MSKKTEEILSTLPDWPPVDKPRLFEVAWGRGAFIWNAANDLSTNIDEWVQKGYLPHGPVTIQNTTEPQEASLEPGRSYYGPSPMRLPDVKVVHMAVLMAYTGQSDPITDVSAVYSALVNVLRTP